MNSRQFAAVFAAIALFAVVVVPVLSFAPVCDSLGPRQDCGVYGTKERDCIAKGCCWYPNSPAGQPWCAKKVEPTVRGYKVSSVNTDAQGVTLGLDLISPVNFYGNDLSKLQVQVSYTSRDRIRVKIVDPASRRWEIPQELLPDPDVDVTASAATSNLIFSYDREPFSFKIIRKSDNSVLFNTKTERSLIYENQYLEISTVLPEEPYVYGFGERNENLLLDYNNVTYTSFSKDIANPRGQNLYGVHPFYLEMRNGKTHGVFLRNSNAQEVTLNPGLLTYHLTGGILDFTFFVGGTPEQTIKQYQEVIGKPYMPAIWTLGWHQCRWGFKNLSEIKEVVKQYHANRIPLDTIWSDIDYMEDHKDFSWDPVNFPVDQIKDFVEEIHSRNQHYVVIVDPGIPNKPGYEPYDDGVRAGAFVKNWKGDLFVGNVWPGDTVYPDFLNPATTIYWKNLITKFLDEVPIDGLWIDMNEASNFCDGECVPAGQNATYPPVDPSGFNPRDPPYKINNGAAFEPLHKKTLDMDAVHFGENAIEYNVHSLYGFSEGIATRKALENYYKNKRAFILSRSTFAGSGHHVHHWLGDNFSTWAAMKESIAGIINMNMFGIPLVGSDICGFIDDATEELCARWHAMGAFYTFSRNHNILGAIDQYPYLWKSVQEAATKSLNAKYSLLFYYYTLFYYASKEGGTVARSLFFEFPQDPKTWAIDTQFLIGKHLLISPVLEKGATSVSAYLPNATWYSFWDGTPIQGGAVVELDAPLTFVPVHVKAGTILPLKMPKLTTVETRKTPFNLVVALDETGSARGSVFVDDGEDLNLGEEASLFKLVYKDHFLHSTASFDSYKGADTCLDVSQVTIWGWTYGTPGKIIINDNAELASFKLDSTANILTVFIEDRVSIRDLKVDIIVAQTI